jgi:hypothetical protein
MILCRRDYYSTPADWSFKLLTMFMEHTQPNGTQILLSKSLVGHVRNLQKSNQI